MGSNLAPDLKKRLLSAGSRLECAGKGDHEIWDSPLTDCRFVVDQRILSRHTANAVLRQPGVEVAGDLVRAVDLVDQAEPLAVGPRPDQAAEDRLVLGEPVTAALAHAMDERPVDVGHEILDLDEGGVARNHRRRLDQVRPGRGDEIDPEQELEADAPAAGTPPLVGAQPHPLMENDVIELAGVKMEFSFIS